MKHAFLTMIWFNHRIVATETIVDTEIELCKNYESSFTLAVESAFQTWMNKIDILRQNLSQPVQDIKHLKSLLTNLY